MDKIKPTTKCISCDTTVKEIEKESGRGYVDEGLMLKDGWVCHRCRAQDEEEPAAVVIYGNGGEEDRAIVGTYVNETNGDFKAKWHSSDAWRGHYVVESETYSKVADDCILAGSQDAVELEKFDKELRAYCDKEGIRYARVFARTSNLFSQGYDFFVHKDDIADMRKGMVYIFAMSLRSKYRDPQRFTMTALTGKDKFDEKDKLLAQAYGKLKDGEDFETVKDFIESEVQKEAQGAK